MLRHSTAIRTGRLLLALVVSLVVIIGIAAPTSASFVLKTRGVIGLWEAADEPAGSGQPRCRYEGAAGSFFLRKVRVDLVAMFGTETDPHQVGYRVLLQRRTPDGWRTTQRGRLIKDLATDSGSVLLPASGIRRDPDKSPNSGRYRAAIKAIWWDETDQVGGFQVVAMEHHRRTFDGSVGPSCRARVPIAP